MASSHFSGSISDQPVEVIESRFQPSATHGADLRFHGIVRGYEDEKSLVGIEYSHYPAMALQELMRIGAAMERDYPPHLAQVHHVVGFVPAGVASIIIRVQTPHSAEGFEICREYLRRIKTSVPIWKKPVFAESNSDAKTS